MTTPILELDEMQASQSQPHIVHNSANRRLEAAASISTTDRGLNSAPASPPTAARYIVGTAPTGAWAGHANEIAFLEGGAWQFLVPLEGWIAHVNDEDEFYKYTGTAWEVLTIAGGSAEGHASIIPLVIDSAGDVEIDLALGSCFDLELTDDIASVSIIGLAAGEANWFTLRVHQDTTGYRIFTLPGSWLFASGVDAYEPTPDGLAVDRLNLISYDGGASWEVSYAKDFT